ncbi:hypothetical protein NYA30BAC_03947 [Halomonas sp. NYA30]
MLKMASRKSTALTFEQPKYSELISSNANTMAYALGLVATSFSKHREIKGMA